ncbi:ABC transporter substrate-binding protein [Bradyrhizobium erythrophlei]|uniref:ABC-type branched-chain amino acid transport system, substrate-binding protein n=1 Tax=Bradyrhizobium erythrophlei TaxID=1437360 RepID=A0A1M7T710_9BRAD|nr:ABC transporter substrate-binding protein [Bradyrhizobium erythrophlei]SHN66477.1 ABC-type branched-chain amino acid transport system, substrate-binding protein [Bradyrhizobium erythrophlei]
MFRWIVAGFFAAWPFAASGDPLLRSSDATIRVGNLMPYTGQLAAFGAIGRAEAAYFRMLNERGGINGRTVEFISYDDSSDPLQAVDLTRNLVEAENALFVFGSFGTPSNLAVRKYLNEKRIPQLFVASGDDQWANPKDFPWTMGWPPAFRTEGRIFANYIQAYYPEKKIGVLWQNDEFGRDLFRGMQEGLGDAARMIVADTAFDATDRSLGAQLDLLHKSGVEILVFDGAPAMAAQVIRRLGESGWHPVLILDNAAASIANALRPGGLENAIGVISTAFLKDGSDPAWKDDVAMKEYLAFMDRYYPEGDKEDSYAVFGYAVAETLAQVLRQCGDDFSRENVMQQAQSLKNFRSSVTLPGIAITTSPSDFRPVKEMRLVQFDGRSWQPIGQLFDNAFTGPGGASGTTGNAR